MPIDTDQTCVYVILDVGSGAGNGDELEIEITDPSTEVTVDAGTVTPNTPVAIAGTTTLQTANQNPNSPSSLVQKKTDDTTLSTGDWTDETSVLSPLATGQTRHRLSLKPQLLIQTAIK